MTASANTRMQVILIRDRRWGAALLLGAVGLVVSGRALADASSTGAAWLFAAYLVSASLAVVSNIGLRPRLIGDRAGIRLRGLFIPWQDVLQMAVTEPSGPPGQIHLTGDRTLTLPGATRGDQADALIALWKDSSQRSQRTTLAADEGEASHAVAAPPLRFPPMDREPLPSGVSRVVASVAITAMVLAVMLWSQLPSVGGPKIPATPHFPSTALRPVWTQYLEGPRSQVSAPSAAAAGLFVFQGSQDMPQQLELTRLAPSGQIEWSRLLAGSPNSPTSQAAGPSGVLVASSISRVNGPPKCCALSLIDNSGARVWEGKVSLRGGRPTVVASGSDFVVVDPARSGGTGWRPNVFAVSGSGGIVSAWRLSSDTGEYPQVWGSEGGLIVATRQQDGAASQLVEYSINGNPQWRGTLQGVVTDIATGPAGTYALTQVSGSQIWVSRIVRGHVVWSNLDLKESASYYGPHSRFSLLVDGDAGYQMETRTELGGTTTWIERLDPHTGVVRGTWQVATVRQASSIVVANGVVYLISYQRPRTYVAQRLGWPPAPG